MQAWVKRFGIGSYPASAEHRKTVKQVRPQFVLDNGKSIYNVDTLKENFDGSCNP